MHAAHDAAGVPLVVGQRVDRSVSTGDTSLEKRIEIQSAPGDQPEQHEGDRAEVVERIKPVAEGGVEQRLHAHEGPSQ